jgi:hypothetical protein
VQNDKWNTVEDRREAVAALLHTAGASMHMSHPAPAGAAYPAALTQSQSSGQEATAAAQLAGCDSKWVAAEGCLQQALQDLMQQQQQRQQCGQGPPKGRGVQCTMRLVGKLRLRDRLDVQAKYLLACMEVRDLHLDLHRATRA